MISLSNKCCGFDLSINQRILKNYYCYYKILCSTTIVNIDANKCLLCKSKSNKYSLGDHKIPLSKPKRKKRYQPQIIELFHNMICRIDINTSVSG